MKVIKIGLDLDGVIIDKPPLVPKKLLEWLVRSYKNKGLAYRYPISRFEQLIRWLSHHPLFRPPIRENLEFIKKIAKKKKYKLYLISGRYSFLEDRTWQWLRKHKVENLFEEIFINLKNEQPHLFKEKMIKNLKIDIFIDDDLPLASYLSQAIPKTKTFCLDQERYKKLEEVFSK